MKHELALRAKPVLDSKLMHSQPSTLFVAPRIALRSRLLALTLLLRR